MASRRSEHWSANLGAPSRRDRVGGNYRAYVPDRLTVRPLVVTERLSRRIAEVEHAVRSLAADPATAGLEHLARFLLRSEAIASSQIEGLQVSPQQVALVELADLEGGVSWRVSDNARLVANNITTLRKAGAELADQPAIAVADIEALQASLLTSERFQGLRTRQNWIGGSDWHPLEAEYVPPPPSEVEPLMRDLVAYLNGAAHSPLVQAGLVHAQFETIHPFADGNGRVGRALIHTVLTRRGLLRGAVLPISPVLLTRGRDYIDGLTASRHEGRMDSAEAHQACELWMAVFLDAVADAVELARSFVSELSELRLTWNNQLQVHRAIRGVRVTPRADSVTAMLLESLPELPVVTAGTVERHFRVSFNSARRGVEELADASVLTRRKVDRGTTAYLAGDVFELLAFTERRIASTRWDTRESGVVRPVPARPQKESG